MWRLWNDVWYNLRAHEAGLDRGGAVKNKGVLNKVINGALEKRFNLCGGLLQYILNRGDQLREECLRLFAQQSFATLYLYNLTILQEALCKQDFQAKVERTEGTA